MKVTIVRNYERLYLMFLLLTVVAACSSTRDAWIASVDAPLDTGASAWRDRVKAGW